MKQSILTMCLVALLGVGCTTVAPPSLTADDPASPQAPEAPESADPARLLAGSEPLAQWLATNQLHAAGHDGHTHGQEQHQLDAPQKPAQKPHEHQHP